MRLPLITRSRLGIALAAVSSLSFGSGAAVSMASEAVPAHAAVRSAPASTHVGPAVPATVPAGAAAPAVSAAVSSAYGRSFRGVPGSVSGYIALDGLGVALNRRGTAPQAPASTTKLITTGAALLTMGPESRFTTTVMRTGSDGYNLVVPKPVPVVTTYFPLPVVAVTAAPSASATPAAGDNPAASDPPSPSVTSASQSGATDMPSPADPTGVPPDPSSSLPSPTPSAVQSALPLPVLGLAPVEVPRAADSGGTLHGDLVLVGAGDPSFGSGDLAALARSVRSAGVAKVTGGVYLDVSKFDAQRGAPGWKKGYVGDESGPLSALMVDGNHRSLSSSYRANPDASNLALFMADLKSAGVKVARKGQVRRSTHAVTGQVAAHSSTPLTTILRHQDVYSDNTYAEEILKDVGAQAGGAGSSAAGVNVEKAIAASFGLTLGRLVDGSGLSTRDRLSAAQEVAWLQAIDTTPVSAAFRSELAINCRPGTLAGRICGNYLSGRVEAKTGTLDHTANLAGFTATKSGRRVWFSLMADKSNDALARRAIDATVASLARSNF